MAQNIYKAFDFDVSVPLQDNLSYHEVIKWLLKALVERCGFSGEGIRIRKKRNKHPIAEREAPSSFEFEIEILAQPHLRDEDVVSQITDALHEWCDFEGCIIKLKKVHKTVVVDVDEPAEG